MVHAYAQNMQKHLRRSILQIEENLILFYQVKRNSNLELLRIIAMLMILYTHLGISPEDGIGKFTFGLLEYWGG